MDVFIDPDAVREWSDNARAHGGRVGLVPTMGALHDGHRALIDLARRTVDNCVVSIFVNPLQFDRDAAFDAYPRAFEGDVEQCRALGVHALYAPPVATMYPTGFDTTVQPGALAETMEGAMRPGHFAGVTTVVTKLLAAVRPDLAVFGEKDYQQLVIIRRMAADLDLGVDVVGAPTVREPDGVALSSRNLRLDPTQRLAARCMPRALDAASGAVAAGSRRTADVVAAAIAEVDSTAGAVLEYVTVFDADTLVPLDDVTAGCRVAIAVWFGDVRLIDNRAL